MHDLEVAYARAKNLGRRELGIGYDTGMMLPAERALADAVEGEEGALAEAVARADWEGALALLADLRGPIDAFFTDVLVMDPDEEVRDNRLRLLNRFVAVFDGVADFSKLAG
jgi:glycyl-tRNA synthetase beta chain